jgi:hypothetical protein
MEKKWISYAVANAASDLVLIAALWMAKTDSLPQLAGLVGSASYFGKLFFS